MKFHASSQKSEILHLDELILSKAYKIFDAKVQKSFCLLTLKRDAKFEEKLTLGSKNDMRNLVNFNVSSGKSENLNFDVTFVESILCLSQKSKKELCVITLKNDAKFEKELTCALKNHKRNLANFEPTLESHKINTLTGFFSPKCKMFELKK